MTYSKHEAGTTCASNNKEYIDHENKCEVAAKMLDLDDTTCNFGLGIGCVENNQDLPRGCSFKLSGFGSKLKFNEHSDGSASGDSDREPVCQLSVLQGPTEQEIDETSASKAIDADSSSKWSSTQNRATRAWYKIDLKRSYILQQVDINWDACYCSEYKIQYSTDDYDWLTGLMPRPTASARLAGARSRCQATTCAIFECGVLLKKKHASVSQSSTSRL
jgi:hypothetical protein